MQPTKPDLAEQIKKLGAFDLAACYNCGSCSAVCPLSEGDRSFPRRMIRSIQLGLEKKVLAAPEAWLCYYCGECSQTCPRQADPGGLMMALRRFAIRKYSIGRLADIFYSARASGIAWLILTAVALAAVIGFHSPAMNRSRVDFLSFISLDFIHIAGIAIMGFIVLAFLANIRIMIRAMKSGLPPGALSWKKMKASTLAALRETVWQKRFGTCEDNGRHRLAHLAVSWGFMGMFLATLIISAVDFKWLPLPRWISLALGSLSGLASLCGLAYFGYLRFSRKNPYGGYSHPSDWAFLVLLGLSIVSGFAMVVFRFLNLPMAAYVAFTVHLVAVFNFLMALPFTKFAHVIYRPVALWLAGEK